MILHFALAFVATAGFSIMFNVPKKELIFCGITGAFGWLVFQIPVFPIVASTFFAALVIAAISRALSFRRKMPANLYMIPGVIPLVPGAGIYYTMYYTIAGNSYAAFTSGIQTLMISGVIAIGLLTVFSLPKKIFQY